MLEDLSKTLQLGLARGLARALGIRVKGGAFEEAAGTGTKPTFSLIAALGGGPTRTGIRVGPGNALHCSAVYKCVRLLGESVAMPPLNVYTRLPGGDKEPDPKHDLYPLLHDAPNDVQTSFEWREMQMGHQLLRGNAYSQVIRDGRGRVRSIVPFHPDRVSIYQAPEDGSLFYYVTPVRGGPVLLPAGNVLHMRGLTSDGVNGLSPITLMAESIGLAMGSQAYRAYLFRNGANLSGFLKVSESLEEEEAKELLRKFKETHAALENTGAVALFDANMEWVSMGMTAQDAQVLESGKFENSDIYGCFGVPPHMVGDTERSTSWGTGIEQQTIGFHTFTLLPHVKRHEQRYNFILFTPEERQTHFVEHNLAGLVRGDLKSRYMSYAIGRQWGWLCVNDVRRLENMNSIGPEGDVYLQPMNMVSVGTQDERQLAEDAEKLYEQLQGVPMRFAAVGSSGKPSRSNGHSLYGPDGKEYRS